MSDDEELLYGLLGTQFNVDADIDTENRRQKLKRKAIDDEVTDEKGRALRFHGAFTGGFNAGYYNTVGSKDGFTPQQYISQGKKGGRSIRQFKPEDFMDDEDFSEHGIAPKLLKTKAVFDDEDIRKHLKQSLGSNSIIGDSDILKDILVPQKLTIGIVLLKKLGYVASLGVGDQDKSDDNSDDNDENLLLKKMEKFDYEADEIYQLVGQMNKFGLGYSGINRESRFADKYKETNAVNFGHKGKRGIKGTAFGVGVDEDEEDLEDFYAGDSMTKYNFEIVEDDVDKEKNFGWTAPRKISNAIMESGSIVGFQLSRNRVKATRIIYEPPNPPRFFNPIYPIRREKDKKPNDKHIERPKLMPDDNQKSVFNLISLEDRERLMNITQDQRVRKSSSRWGDAPNVTTVKVEETKEESDNLPTFYKPNEKSLQKKKGSQKTWNLTSNFGSMFKSAGKSSETQDINYSLTSLVKSEIIEKPEDVLKIDAANLENYGFLTRKIISWHPDKLLCKRFNIADPYPECSFSGIPDEEIKEKTPPISILEVLPAKEEVLKVEPEIKPPPVNIPSAVESSNPPDVEIKTTVLDVSDKPAIDLFKSVFADSDAEFSSSDEEITEPVAIPDKIKKPDEPQMSIISSLEQALNAMIGGNNQPSQPSDTSVKQQSESKVKFYGPSMPPGFVPNSVVVEHIHTDVNQIISKNIKEHLKDPLEDLYDFKEKTKVKKSKKDKKSKKKKSKKKKSH